jgi:hypothetical protein
MKIRLQLLSMLCLISLGISCIQIFEPGPATFVKSIENSSNNKQAIMFIKGGNATSADSYQISIKSTDEKLGAVEVGNTFTCDGDHGKAFPDSNSIKMQWLTNTNLQITYDKNIRTFVKEKKVDGIDVVYKTY